MRSLQGRLMLAVGLLAIAALVGVAFAARHSARHGLDRFVELEGRTVHREALRSLREAAGQRSAQGVGAADVEEMARRLPPGIALLLVGSEGELVAAAGLPPSELPPLATRRVGETLVVESSRSGPRGEALELRMRGAGVPVRLPDGRAGALHLLPLPPALRERHAATVLHAVDRRLIAATAGAGALALLLTWAVSRRLLEPVRELGAATRDLARGDLRRRVSAAGADELAELGRAFNRMADELERQERLRRDLVHDVAHELRAPLTALRCRVEAVQDGLVSDVRGAVDELHEDLLHLSRLVDDLQDLALAEAGRLRFESRVVDLAAAVRATLPGAGLSADRRVRIEVAEGLAALADPVRVRQTLANLLTNAARHTPETGTIRIAARNAGEEIEVEVVDSGCGIDPEHLPRVFERFSRTDESRQRATGGSGLGLAIVKSLVEAQGGRVWARSTPGEGAAFGFSLPAAQAAPHEPSPPAVASPSGDARYTPRP